MNIKSQERRSDEGFTLIELLVVIVILGILSAVVVFAVGGITDKGESAACEATSKTVQTASEAYRANNTGYAASLADLAPEYLSIRPDPTSNVITLDDGSTVTYSSTGSVTDTCP